MTAHCLKIAAILVTCGAVSAIAKQAPSPANSAQRGLEALSEGAQARHGHHYVVAIGIDHYQNWPVLNTAVSDAVGFAKLLTSQFGFEYAAEPLTEKSATRDNINALIDDELRNKLKPDDDLIIFFAGHGTTRKDKVGDATQPVGFLVPFEARAPGVNEHWSDYLNIEELLRKVSSLPSEHILIILDSCHSGLALGSKFTSKRADTRFEKEMALKLSREVITSARGDELAADQGPLPGHSLFTGLMLQGLTTGNADAFAQGFITASQLGAYTQHQVALAASSRQIPLYGTFDLDDGGELILPLGSGTSIAARPAPQTLAVASAPTLNNLESNEIARIKRDGNSYWRDDDPLKNFPAARSGLIKLCDSGDSWGCGQAANILRLGLGGPPDPTRSAELAKAGCLNGALNACEALGNLYADGKGVAQNYDYAKSMFKKVCDGGDMSGCTSMGLMLTNGVGVEKDQAQAITLFQKACDLGDMRGCRALGAMYERGLGVHPSPVVAAKLFQEACDGGEMNGCSGLGYLYDHGEGVAKDDLKAVQLYRNACDGGDMVGCVNLSAHYYNGTGVPQNLTQASALLHKACDGGYENACKQLKQDK